VTGEQGEIVGLQVDGFELELKGQLTEALVIAAGYTSMDGTTGKEGVPREIPESTMHLWANYQLNSNFGLGIGFAYQDEQNIKNDKPGLILPDYTRWDAAAYYNLSDNTVIRLNIENLSDELYFPFSHSTHQASVGKDINARLSITRRF
jgi:catecholate siderophore receptor